MASGYEAITRFLSRRARVYAEFSREAIEQAVRHLGVRARVQFLAAETGRLFAAERAWIRKASAPRCDGLYECTPDAEAAETVGLLLTAERKKPGEPIHALTSEDPVERGKRNLETAAAEAILAGDDARIILSLIYTRERAYALALAKRNKLAAGYPENYLVALDRAGIARRMGRPGFAIEILGGVLGKLQRREDGFERLERSSVYNQIGLAWRDKGAFRAAENWFRLSIEEPDVSPRTRTIAQLELAKTLDLARRHTEALPLYRAVATAADVAGSSEEAAEWVKRPFEAK